MSVEICIMKVQKTLSGSEGRLIWVATYRGRRSGAHG